MAELRRADTALAEWLAHAMARWVNPETQMPGISQRRLAEETGVSQTQLHAIIKKGHSPGSEILLKFADFFGANPLSLFALTYLSEGSKVSFDIRRSDQTLTERGYPWCVVDDQGDAVAYFKNEHHAETFRMLASAEAGKEG
jgi:transcriptional regulator with XRE-family HTH domain